MTRVDGENVGLFCQLRHDVEDRADFLRFLSKLQHVRDNLIDLAADAADRLMRQIDSAVAVASSARRLFRIVRHALRAFGWARNSIARVAGSGRRRSGLPILEAWSWISST